MFAFVTAGLCAAITGTLLSSLLGSGTLGGGDGYLLDAFAAVFLGSATLREGEFHIAGTFVGVLILTVGFNGLAILGAPTHFQPIFKGGILILAVGVSGVGKALCRIALTTAHQDTARSNRKRPHPRRHKFHISWWLNRPLLATLEKNGRTTYEVAQGIRLSW